MLGVTMPSDRTPWEESDGESGATGDVGTEGSVSAESAEVMASVDESRAGPEFVIADISTEEAWLSVRQTDAPVLEEWC